MRLFSQIMIRGEGQLIFLLCLVLSILGDYCSELFGANSEGGCLPMTS